MQTVKRLIALLCAAAVLLSCEGQTYNVAELVDPKVTKVYDDGKQANVNIGLFDGVHVGQQLWVVRNNRPAGMLMVRNPKDYMSECTVVAPSKTTTMPSGSGEIRAGDLVTRDFRGVTAVPSMREKVPRMVAVPYEADNETLATVDKALGGTEKRKKIWTRIPRDQIEAWRRRHPNVGRIHP